MTQDGEGTKGIDVAAVTAWYAEHVPDARAPLSFSLIAGGHSNLTYKVVDAAGRETVLRRPPLSHVLASAHDMGREHKIISALHPTNVPVPKPLGFCADAGVNGAPFYVMDYVPGIVLHDVTIALRELDERERRSTGESFIDVLADLHVLDPDEIGLTDLAKKEDYVARQLKRWYGQYRQSKTRELPAVDRVHDFLKERIPPQGKASVVHGDYRLGNCITQKPGRIAAVLDWEICTLGDPLADLGYVLATWPHPDDPIQTAPGTHAGPPSLAPGMPSREEVLERYARRSGRDLSRIDFYLAFAYWKSACIIEGVYSRYVGGALGETTVDLDAFKTQIENFAVRAEQTTTRI
jgi:aminoglycoside phosphotransferase (APT) family kinase protein